DGVDVFDFFARAEIVHHVVDEIQQLANQILRRNFLLLAEINHLPVEAPAHGAPLVFLNQHAAIEPEAEILIDQFVEFGDDGLEERSDSDCVVNARGNVADAKLERGKERMRPGITPNLFAVVDAAGLDQQIDVSLKPGIGIEVIGNVSALKLIKDI